MIYSGNEHLVYWRYKHTNDDLSQHSINIYRKMYDAQDPELIDTISAENTQYLDDFFTHDHYKSPENLQNPNPG